MGDRFSAMGYPTAHPRSGARVTMRTSPGELRARPWRYPQTASQQCARQLLVESGTVLDVGCRGGQSSVPLVPAATSITGVDEQESMLQSFAMACENAGVAHSEVLGRWLAIAAHVVPADVAVCHHVAYDVADTESLLRDSRRTPAVASWSSYRRSTQRHRWQRCGNTSGDLHGRWGRRWTLAPRRQVTRLRAAIRSDRAAPEQAVYCPSGSQRRKADDRYGDLGIHYSLTTTH